MSGPAATQDKNPTHSPRGPAQTSGNALLEMPGQTARSTIEAERCGRTSDPATTGLLRYLRGTEREHRLAQTPPHSWGASGAPGRRGKSAGVRARGIFSTLKRRSAPWEDTQMPPSAPCGRADRSDKENRSRNPRLLVHRCDIRAEHPPQPAGQVTHHAVQCNPPDEVAKATGMPGLGKQGHRAILTHASKDRETERNSPGVQGRPTRPKRTHPTRPPENRSVAAGSQSSTPSLCPSSLIHSEQHPPRPKTRTNNPNGYRRDEENRSLHDFSEHVRRCALRVTRHAHSIMRPRTSPLYGLVSRWCAAIGGEQRQTLCDPAREC